MLCPVVVGRLKERGVTVTANCEYRDTSYWLRTLRDRGFHFPNTYIVFDLETTGLDVTSDLAVQIGMMVVEDGEVTEPPRANVLNWADYRGVNQHCLRDRLLTVARDMAAQDNPYPFTYEGLREGCNPIKLLRGYLDLFRVWQDGGGHFLAHNGCKLDKPMMEQMFKKHLNETFHFDARFTIDTGLFEKAMQQPRLLLPQNRDDLPAFYVKTIKCYSRGVKWSLFHHCVPKYKLAQKYDIDLSKAHSADFDCLVTHSLYQEMRKLSQ